MYLRLLIAGILSVIATASEVVVSSRFYIVSEFFSDYGAAFYYRLLDVHQDGPDSVVRYSRVAFVNIQCPRMVVQSAEARLPGKSISDLIGATNPCAIKPGAFRAALKNFATRGSVLDTISFGLAARCRSSDVIFELPIPEKVDPERLAHAHPDMARLWELASTITDAAFGPQDIFHNRTEEDDAILQRAGEKSCPNSFPATTTPGSRQPSEEMLGPGNRPAFALC